MVQAFQADGWQVHVLAGRPSYRPDENLVWRRLRLWQVDGFVTRVRSTRFSRERMAGRIANYVSFTLLSSLVSLIRRADVVVVMTDPPILVIAATIASRLRRWKSIYWLQDYLPEFLTSVGLMRQSLVSRMWSRAHHGGAGRADIVVAIGRDMAQRLSEGGVDDAKVVVIPNGSAVSWVGAQPSPKKPEWFTVVHAGELGMRGAWRAIAGAAGRVGDDVRVVLIGDGVEAAKIRRAAAGNSRLVLRPPIPASEVAAELLAADALLVTIRRGAEGFTVPSKAYELFGAARPIIVVGDPTTEAARLVAEIECGIVVSPDDDGEELSAALNWLQAHPKECAAMGERARRAAPRFDRLEMHGRLVHLANRLVTNQT